MNKSEVPPNALNRLRAILNRVMSNPVERLDNQGRDILEAKHAVVERYGQLFAEHNIPKLTSEDFLSFLRFRNNRHWEGLHRRGPDIVADLGRLRAALGALVDESRPITERIDDVLEGSRKVPFLGKAIVTAILMVVYPDRYAVWNRKSQDGMQALGLWPERKGATVGETYVAMNSIALDVASALKLDLWTLDILWWRVMGEDDDQSFESPDEDTVVSLPSAPGSPGVFALEAHLHEFLEENWDNTELGKGWDLLEEDGQSIGSHYQTKAVGEIDLLAHHKREPRWLVVELKRNQTSDATVGQILRYMSWVREKLAKPNERVEGLIVCREANLKLRYAIADLPHVRCMSYEVSFQLQPTRWPEPAGDA